MQIDYYKILGVSTGSTADEIKKAYRKLAMEFHPDRNPGDKTAEDKFKRINEAYTYLSTNHRQQTFKVADKPAPKSNVAPRPPKNAPFHAIVELTLEEIETGVAKHLSAKALCSRCNGSGRLSENPYGDSSNVGAVNWSANRVGKGYVDPERDKCYKCTGTGEMFLFAGTFNIPAGLENGDVVKLGLNNRHYSLKVKELPHPLFTRKGNDLYLSKKVDASILRDGGKLHIDHLNGKKFVVTVPVACDFFDTTLRLEKNGLPDLNTKEYGDFYLKLSIY